MDSTGRVKFARILVAVDGSESSQRAAETAIELAKMFAAELTVLHILETPVTPYQSDRPTEIDIGRVDEAARTKGERMVSATAALAEFRGVKEVRQKVVMYMGSAAQGITDHARKNGIDLIVVGTRGLTGIKRLAMGTVARNVLGSAGCSVLVVR